MGRLLPLAFLVMIAAKQIACSANPAPLVGPDVSAIYFAGWNDTYEYPATWSFYTKFPNRYSSLYTVDGWEKGTGIDTAAIVAGENAAASDAGITAWCFDFYLPSTVVNPADPDEKHEWLQAGLEGYLASSNKSLMKFWVMGIMTTAFGLSYPATDPLKYFDDFAAYIANLMLDPQYLTIRGEDGIARPVLGIAPSGGGSPEMTLALWDQFTAPMGGRSALFVIVTNGDTAKATELHAQAVYRYGKLVMPVNQGHQPWTLSKTGDKNAWPASGNRYPIVQVTATNDIRALDNSVTANTWVDRPTQKQLYDLWVEALAQGGSKQAITIWNELAEEDISLSPSLEEGDRLLQALKWARKPATKPATFSYKINANSKIVTSSGVWTYTDPRTSGGVPGCHERDQVIASTAGDFKELPLEMIACDVYAETGPDCGIVEIYKGGVLDQTVDCYSAGQSVSVKIATVVFAGPMAAQTVRLRVTGTKNPASSSVQIKFDYFFPSYNP